MLTRKMRSLKTNKNKNVLEKYMYYTIYDKDKTESELYLHYKI